jgi:hypothetical protein
MKVCVPHRAKGAQPLTASGAAAQPCHRGVDGGLIEDNEAARLAPHARLASLEPLGAPRGDVGARKFGGHP